MKTIKYLTALICICFITTPVFAQTFNPLYDKVVTAFKSKNYSTTVDLCKQIINHCQSEKPDSECQFTDRMKNVYHFRGVAEFELWVNKSDPTLLDDAIASLQLSYNWYHDPDVSYKLGYIQSIRAIETGKGDDFVGMVNAWQGILELYAATGWTMNDDLVQKLKTFIGQAVELSVIPKDNDNTTGKFTSMMINLACDLSEKANLSQEDREFFRAYRQIATDDESNLRANEWRARGFEAERAFKESPNDSTYNIVRENFEKAYQFVRSPQRRAEILTELAKVALFMDRNSASNRSDVRLKYAREKASQAYNLIRHGRLAISNEEEIRTVYGTSVLNLVNYYYNLADVGSEHNYVLARRVGEELLSLDGANGYVQNFKWDGYENLYRQLSLVGYELGDQAFAVDMADKAWKTALGVKGLTERGACSVSTEDAKELLRYAENYDQVAERFGLQPMQVWIRPFINCLSEKAGL